MQLRGLGIASDVQAAVTGFITSTPNPTSAQITSFLQLFADSQAQSDAAAALVAAGISPTTVASATTFLSSTSGLTASTIWGALTVASAAASGYHGYRRNQSIGWASFWFLMGGIFPVFTPVIALAQGFGKRKAG